jgi:hypothetical protein
VNILTEYDIIIIVACDDSAVRGERNIIAYKLTKKRYNTYLITNGGFYRGIVFTYVSYIGVKYR